MEETDIDNMVNEVLINILKVSNKKPVDESDYWTSRKQRGEYKFLEEMNFQFVILKIQKMKHIQ
jgi:hypothetical protein